MSSDSFGRAVSRTPNSDTITLSDSLSAVGDYLGSYEHQLLSLGQTLLGQEFNARCQVPQPALG